MLTSLQAQVKTLQDESTKLWSDRSGYQDYVDRTSRIRGASPPPSHTAHRHDQEETSRSHERWHSSDANIWTYQIGAMFARTDQANSLSGENLLAGQQISSSNTNLDANDKSRDRGGFANQSHRALWINSQTRFRSSSCATTSSSPDHDNNESQLIRDSTEGSHLSVCAILFTALSYLMLTLASQDTSVV